MKDVMNIVMERWTQYWGEGAYQFLFCAAVFYLFLFKRKKEYVKNVLLYVVIVLAVFWCPVSAVVIQKCIGKSVYWRVLWLLLNVPICALASAEFIKDKKKQWKVILLALVVFAIAVSGKSVLKAGVYEPLHNYQKVPYEVGMVCTMVKEDAGEMQVHLATDDHLASYIRVYDASITMPYGRAGRDYVNKKGKKLYNEISSAEKNYELIAEYAKDLGCNYVVFVVTDAEGLAIMEQYGYQAVGSVNSYTVFGYKD